jgi:hypothetical protein
MDICAEIHSSDDLQWLGKQIFRNLEFNVECHLRVGIDSFIMVEWSHLKNVLRDWDLMDNLALRIENLNFQGAHPWSLNVFKREVFSHLQIFRSIFLIEINFQAQIESLLEELIRPSDECHSLVLLIFHSFKVGNASQYYPQFSEIHIFFIVFVPNLGNFGIFAISPFEEFNSSVWVTWLNFLLEFGLQLQLLGQILQFSIEVKFALFRIFKGVFQAGIASV